MNQKISYLLRIVIIQVEHCIYDCDNMLMKNTFCEEMNKSVAEGVLNLVGKCMQTDFSKDYLLMLKNCFSEVSKPLLFPSTLKRFVTGTKRTRIKR
jgi:hypothetical protein